MSVSTDTHNGGDRMVDAMVEFISDILTDHFIMDIEVRRTVAKQLLASGKFVDYAGQKYDLLAEATHQFSTEASERDLFGMQRQTINVRAGLDPAEKTQIATANPDVDVRFTDTTDMPHGVAYAQRIIDTNRALALVDHKYGPVLDIGGNYAAHAMSQRKIDIHSCTLLQGEVEYHRQTQRDVVLEYANVEAGSFCRDGVQNCDFQAVHGISIHALPDIDPDLWPAIFRRHGLEYVVAFFHYDTAMETDAVGYIAAAGMHWHVQESNVHFYFENDSSHGYTHNRNWLLEYGSTWMRTDDDWDFVVLYQVDFVDGGRAQASLTRLQKDTIGAQEITPAYRFIDVDDMMELIVPKFDPSLGKSVHDPRGYGYETVRVPSAMFSYLYRFGLANDTERPDLPLSLDSMREHAHAFNHVRKVNGTDITTPVRLNHQLIDDIALGMYLLVVKRAAMGKVIYTRYTDHMRGLQGRWSKSDVLSMVANSFSYVAIAPFMLLASSMSEVVDLVAMHMRSVVGEEKVLASAQEVLPYRRIMPVRPVHGAAVSDLAGAHYVPRNVVPEHGDIEPRQFFDVFQHTMDESSRRKVEKYLREHEPTDEQEEVAHTPVVQTYIVKFPERRQEWIDAYRLFDGYLEDKHPPVLTSAVQMEDRVEPQLVWEFYAPRVYELSMYMADVGLHVISSAESLMRDTWAGCAPNCAAMHDRNVQEDAGIVYYRVNEGVIDGMQLDDPYNMIIDPHDGRHLEVFVRNAECRVVGAKADFVFACESLRVFNYFQLGRRAYKTAQAMGKPRNVKAVLMDGVPGCGKTFQILQAFTDKDVIVVAVKSTREAILRQLSTDERFKGMQKQLSNRVRTIDSGCMHGIPLAQILYVDEGLMAHSGALTQLVHESQPAEMRVFGDSEQIALIDRGSKLGDLHFASLFYWTQVVECNETARTPADATYVWSRLYPESRRDKIRTFSPVLRSMTFEHIPDVKSPQYTDAKYPYVYYSVLRADRGRLAMMPGFVDGKKYEPNADGDSARPVFSVHEVQGETFPFVVLYRMNIYNATVLESKPHRVVATSRHLFRFIYRSPVGPEADPVARAVVEVGKLDDQVLRDIMLPTPQWLQDRMTKHAAKYAKYLD